MSTGLGGNNDACSKNPRHEAFAQAHARGISASAAEENAVLIKKPDKTIKRDEMGRFDRRADRIGQGLAGPGRPKGGLNSWQMAATLCGAIDFGYAEREALFACSAFDELVGWMRRQWVMPHPYANISPSPLQS